MVCFKALSILSRFKDFNQLFWFSEALADRLYSLVKYIE